MDILEFVRDELTKASHIYNMTYLAEITGLTHGQLYKIINGKTQNITTRNASRILNAIGDYQIVPFNHRIPLTVLYAMSNVPNITAKSLIKLIHSLAKEYSLPKNTGKKQ